MEENNEQTEKQMTSQERLDAIETERADLKYKIRYEKKDRIENASKNRIIRDSKLKNTQEILTIVMKEVFMYRKLGKKDQADTDILERIREIVTGEDGETEYGG